MKKLLTMIAATTMLLSVAAPVYAAPWGQVRKEVRQEVKAEVKGAMTTPGLLKSFLQGRAAIGSGKVTAISGTTLTVEKDGKSYNVQTDDKTQFRRRFWGKASFSEFQVGHMVNVIGLWTDNTKTTINARLLRDVSIQARFGTFIGKVLTLTTDGWTMSTISEKRADQTVMDLAGAKFVNRKGETITKADVQVGHRIRIRGMWDRVNNKVTEVKEVKDFSLPALNGTPAVTPTP
jgi:hypothetical protein